MLLIVSFLDILPTRVATDKSVHALDMLEVNTFMVKCCIALGTRNVLPAMFPLHVCLKCVFWICNPTMVTHAGFGLSKHSCFFVMDRLDVAFEHRFGVESHRAYFT